MPLWRPKKERKELIEELGEELVEWGEKLEQVLDELPPDDGAAKPDDLQPPKPLPAASSVTEREHYDRSGNLMGCIICMSPKTVNGKFCRQHYS